MKLRFFRQAAKIDYLAGQPGFAQTPEGKAAIHMLRTRYPESADRAFPLLFREYKRGVESGGQQGIVIPPSYLEHHRLMEAYRDQDPRHAEHHEAILNGDRPDAYFWKMKHNVDGPPEFHPVQPGMMQNLGRMLQWMKGANQPLPNMDSKGTSLEHVEQLYQDWRAKYDRDRDPHLGTVAHTFPDDWTIRTCDNPAECYDEGEEMAHCGAKYAPLVQTGSHTLYSLRDPQNNPHASFVHRPAENTIEDVRGKNNQPVNSNYLSYLTSYFPLLGQDLTISGHPDPQAPPIPEVNQYGLPVVGAEAERQGNRIARILGYPVERYADERNERLGWVIEADKLNDFLRGKVLQTRPCETCGGKKFIEDPATGKRGRCPECHGKGTIPLNDEQGNPLIERHYYPEFSDPNHPDYPTSSPVLDALEKQYHSEQNDQLFPFLVNQYKRGQLRMTPGQEQDHYNPDSGQYERRPGEPRFEYANDPQAQSDKVQEWVEDNLGHLRPEQAERELGYYNERDWDRIKGPDWQHLDRDTLDSYGNWLSETTSQHPSRHGLKTWDDTANDGEGDFVPHPKYPNNLDLNNATFGELEARKKAYDEWLEAKQSIDRSIFKSEDGKHHMVELKPEDCRSEGTKMRNCITGYGEHLKSGLSMIYSLRDKNGKPHLDLELKPKTFFNKETGEELPTDEYQKLVSEATPGRITCPDCEGNGYPILERNEHGHATRLDYDHGHCPTCQGHGRITSEGNPELQERIKGFSPSPFDADVIQVQGKNNKPPLPQYQKPLKEFFSKFPQDRLPKWKFDDPHFDNFNRMFGEDGHAIYYHPGDYGLPDPGVTTDYPSLVRSYLDTGNEDDSQNRRRADFLVNRWAKGHGQLDQLRAALAEPNVLDSVKQQAARYFDPHDTDEMRAWEGANPDPRANLNNPHPEWFDENGNYRDETPEFQQEIAAWEAREQEAWRANEAWQHQRSQMADQIRDDHAGDAYQQLPGYQRWDYANTLANGGDLAVPRINEDMQIVGSVRNAPEWCRCGKCEPEWNLVRVANEQIWNKVRNMLRKNNIATDENLAAWERLKTLYPDASHLGEFLHREFRKGRLKMPLPEGVGPRVDEYDRIIQQRRERARERGREDGEIPYYENRRDRILEEGGGAPEHAGFYVPGQGELTPTMMGHLITEVKKNGQREKGWNVMKQEMGPLAEQAREAEQAERRRMFAGQVVHEFPPDSQHAGWTVRYIDSPEAAKNEHEMMNHCIDKYGDRILTGSTHNYSLRDAEGKAHSTIETTFDNPGGSVQNLRKNSNLDWDKVREVMGDHPDFENHREAVENYFNGQSDHQGGGTMWAAFNHPNAEETRNFLREARARGGITPPSLGASGVYQNTGRSGDNSHASAIREWMETLPYEERPSGKNRYHDTRYIETPEELYTPRVPGRETDEFGFRAPDQQISYNWGALAQNLGNGQNNEDDGAKQYDPQQGQRMYEWARDNQQLVPFYNAVSQWDRQKWPEPSRERGQGRPPCPRCRESVDVVNRGPNEWECTYCRRDFTTEPNVDPELNVTPRQYPQRQGPAYNPYQYQAVQHLAPMFAQHPELQEMASKPTCPACGRDELIPYQRDPNQWYCEWCGNHMPRQEGQVQAKVAALDYIPHFNSKGQPCRCLYYDGPQTRMGDFEVVSNIPSDWGEDADSGLGEPEPAWDYAPAHEQASVIPCPVCQDPMTDGQCKRCDWGDWGREQPTPNPHDPVRDLKSPVQSAWTF